MGAVAAPAAVVETAIASPVSSGRMLPSNIGSAPIPCGTSRRVSRPVSRLSSAPSGWGVSKKWREDIRPRVDNTSDLSRDLVTLADQQQVLHSRSQEEGC